MTDLSEARPRPLDQSTGTAAEPRTSGGGPQPVTVTLDVNGTARTLRLDPRATLLDALREHST